MAGYCRTAGICPEVGGEGVVAGLGVDDGIVGVGGVDLGSEILRRLDDGGLVLLFEGR